MNKQSSTNTKSNIKSNTKKDETLSRLINFGTVILFFGIAILIYMIFFTKPKSISTFESFANTSDIVSTDTLYETALKTLFKDEPRLLCSIIPTIGTNICTVNGTPYVKYNFPIHMIKLIDGSILAVFNDGRLYKKDDMLNTMWQGPLSNSLPNDSIPLRIITLSPDLNTLLGIGYDNKLYMKQPDNNGNLNLITSWRLVPNNTDIIYVLFDNETGYMISIDINGKLFIKTSKDLTSNNVELINRLDRPILRLYYDMNGYMLAIDGNFDMYQFSELNWKNSPLNLQRGANKSKIQDILYYNDGKMFGLVFNPAKYMLEIMKQDQAFYLGDFSALDKHINLTKSVEFVMSDQDIILSKTGNIKTYLEASEASDAADNDPNIAYQKQILETRAKLKNFCSNRNTTTSSNYDNYDLLASVEQNEEKIGKMKDIINNIITYEPDKARIIEKHPIIQS